MSATITKKLLRWCFWFCLGNALLFWLLGLYYLLHTSWLDTSYLLPAGRYLIEAFMAFAYLGQFGMMALLPCLMLMPLAYLFSSRCLVFVTAIATMTTFLIWIAVDIVTYKLYHFHLNGILLNLTLEGWKLNEFALSHLELGLIIATLSGFIILECVLSFVIWKYIIEKNRWLQMGKFFLSGIILSLYFSYAMLIYSTDFFMHHLLIDAAETLPFYTTTLKLILPEHNGRTMIDRVGELFMFQPNKINRPLDYPRQAIHCNSATHPYNIIIIVIDTWRFDMLKASIMPALTHFADESWDFTRHFSGGDATGPGVFSLFYGLPSAYWTAMDEQHQGPVFLKELIKQHYQFGIFASAALSGPPFQRTVFRDIKNLSIDEQPANNPYLRDQLVTQKFKQFIAKAVKRPQPIFSFLFYDGAHSYCSYDRDLHPLQPSVKECNRTQLTETSDPAPYFNRYKNSLMLVDKEVKEVLATLSTLHLLDNTIVLITGDHGEEFNDNHLGYWGHASNFTQYQVQTPLLIHWPHKKAQTFSYQTSHYDVVPTLMQQVLGCTTAPHDYSLGTTLMDNRLRPYLLVNSYVATGVIAPKQITSISPTGDFHVEQLDGRVRPDAELDKSIMEQAFNDLNAFFKGTPAKNPLINQ